MHAQRHVCLSISNTVTLMEKKALEIKCCIFLYSVWSETYVHEYTDSSDGDTRRNVRSSSSKVSVIFVQF
jgi:hypothetical protein